MAIQITPIHYHLKMPKEPVVYIIKDSIQKFLQNYDNYSFDQRVPWYASYLLPIPRNLPNPADWTVSQVYEFLKVLPVGKMLDQEH